MLEGIGDVAATSLITLYCHAIETRSDDPILVDPKSAEIAAELDKTLSRSEQPLAKALVDGMLDKNIVIHIAIRAKKYDAYVQEFLARHPDGVVVNIGCGLDSRFLRIDNGRVTFYDIDLPEIIAIKREFFLESGRYHLIASSVLDYGWMGQVRDHAGPFLFMAEGVFMYLDGDDVRSLVLEITKRFPGSELVCEVENAFWLGPLTKKIVAYKLQHQFFLGKDAVFRSGFRDGREMEQWESGIQFLDDWSYFDLDENKLGWLKVLRHIGWIRKTQWTVRYQLG